jgi:hypothetical protein
MYCETRMCKKYSVHFETPAFKYGVPYTPHPIPYTLFIACGRVSRVVGALVTYNRHPAKVSES